MNELLQLEISKTEDMATVAAILVMNGYTVRKATYKANDGWTKIVLQAKKETEK